MTSARESFYVMVDKVEAPDPSTVVFHLKFATNAFLPALADPVRLDLQESDPRQGPALVREEHHGLRPVQIRRLRDRPVDQGRAQPRLLPQGAALSGWLHRDLRDKQAVRVEAIRADRAAMEFRGLPPSARDQLVKELGDKIAVQESDWNCGNLVTPNHKKKPFDDVRVRRALLLAIDQWHGAPALAKIANVHTVGGLVFPGSPLAATKEELQHARRLLARYRKVARRGQAAVEGSRGRGPQLRALKPECRSAL